MRRYLGFIVSATAFLVAVILIRPWTNFAVSDDFYYLLQVKAFSLGILTRSALINPTIILQIFLGLLWTYILGLSYLSLHLLTIIISVLFIFVSDRILALMDIRLITRIFGLLMIVFTPLFLSLSLSFMSENYFLLFVLLSVYCYLRFLKHEDIRLLLLTGILAGLSVDIRQYGLILPVAYLINLVLIKKRKLKISDVAFLLIPFMLFTAVGLLWPRYQSPSEVKSVDISKQFSSLISFTQRLFGLAVYPYLGLFLLPVSSAVFLKRKIPEKFFIFTVSFPVALKFFRMNIFSLGNLMYLEGLYARLGVNIRENLLNNVPFKLLLSYIIALSCITLVYSLAKFVYSLRTTIASVKTFHRKALFLFFLLSIGFFLIVNMTDRIFDRYFYNYFVMLLITAVIIAGKVRLKLGPLSWVSLAFILSITFLLVYDYYTVNQLKWQLANRLVTENNVARNKIFIDQEYAATVFMEDTQNYRGFIKISFDQYFPSCFVQEYIVPKESLIWNTISTLGKNTYIGSHFANPQIKYAGILKSKSGHYDPEDRLYYLERYYSPLYNLIGKETYVRAFCKAGSV